MDVEAIELFDIEPDQLDRFLSIGWFRLQQNIFTTDIVYFNNEPYKAIWLRVRLQNYLPDKKYFALQKKNARFKTEILKAAIKPEHDALYERYKKSITFNSSPNLQWLLYGNSIRNVYDTYMINMYDGNTLAGLGFFDLGNTSAAGISSFYDPAYKKYSPGRYMIYKKMLYCKERRLKYFYPGYFVPGYARFDYKIEIGKGSLEYWNTYSKTWQPLPTIGK